MNHFMRQINQILIMVNVGARGAQYKVLRKCVGMNARTAPDLGEVRSAFPGGRSGAVRAAPGRLFSAPGIHCAQKCVCDRFTQFF